MKEQDKSHTAQELESACAPEHATSVPASASTAPDVVLHVEHMTKHYPIKKGLFAKSKTYVHALEDVSFDVHRGETFSIVGESGCGKSTAGKCILRLTEPVSYTHLTLPTNREV